MKLFIDSADIKEITKIESYGILDGVTTNPSLIKKSVISNRLEMKDYIKKILRLLKKRPVSLEVIGTDYKSMIREGRILFSKFKKFGNVYIKIPLNPCTKLNCDNIGDGIRTIKELSRVKIPVNCTLVFTPEQALLAAKAGAKFISPFVGRVDDYIRTKNKIKFKKEDYFPVYGKKKSGKILDDEGIVSGIDLIVQCRRIFDIYNINSKILAASIRNKRQFREAAIYGADIATVPFHTINSLLNHYKTVEGMIKFEKDIIKEYRELFRK